jgi:hypothetical protein
MDTCRPGKKISDRAELIYKTEQRLLPVEKRDCQRCRGTGYRDDVSAMQALRVAREDWACPQCGGSGKWVDTREPNNKYYCAYCHRVFGSFIGLWEHEEVCNGKR